MRRAVLLLAALAAWPAGALPAPASRATCADPASARCGALATLATPYASFLLFRPPGGGVFARDARGGDSFWLDGRRLVEGDGENVTDTTFPSEPAAWAQAKAELGFSRAQAEAALGAGAPADQPDWADRLQQPASFHVARQTVVVSSAALARVAGACLLAPRGGRFAGLPLLRAMLISSVYRGDLPRGLTVDRGRSKWQLYEHADAEAPQLQIVSAARRSSRGRNLLAGVRRFYRKSVLVDGRRWWTLGSQAVYAGPQRIYQVARFDVHSPAGWTALLQQLTPVCP